MTLYELVEWWWLLHRARRDPGKFLERAAWHIWTPERPTYQEAGDFLCIAAAYVTKVGEIPGWIVPRKARPWV